MRGGVRVLSMVAAAIVTVGALAGPARAGLSAGRLAKAAEAAYKEQRFVRALLYAEEGLEAPSRTTKIELRLHMVATLAACSLQDGDKARSHAAKLDKARRKLAAQVCKGKDVELDD